MQIWTRPHDHLHTNITNFNTAVLQKYIYIYSQYPDHHTTIQCHDKKGFQSVLCLVSGSVLSSTLFVPLVRSLDLRSITVHSYSYVYVTIHVSRWNLWNKGTKCVLVILPQGKVQLSTLIFSFPKSVFWRFLLMSARWRRYSSRRTSLPKSFLVSTRYRYRSFGTDPIPVPTSPLWKITDRFNTLK